MLKFELPGGVSEMKLLHYEFAIALSFLYEFFREQCTFTHYHSFPLLGVFPPTVLFYQFAIASASVTLGTRVQRS